MKKLQMVDLNSQYLDIKEQVDASIQEVLNNSTFINGPQVASFKNNLATYLNTNHVIPCANGTDALQIALMALELKPDDEVITVDFTFAATVEVIQLLGLTSVLIDVEEDTFNMSITALKKAITPKTKAIIPVHLFGQCANMEAILEIAKEHNLHVIEDTAQALGAEYIFSDGTSKKAGTMGTIGTTSFFPSKNLGCYGDGGAIFTNNDELAHKLKGIVNHGMYKRYYYDVVGVNSRLDSIQAAILDTKLPFLDTYNKARQKAATYYNNAFKNCELITTPITSSFSTHVFHQYTLKIGAGKRDELHEYLKELNIPNAIYYPVALHSQKAYYNENVIEDNFANTNRLIEQVISLPMHTALETEQLEFITNAILKYLNNTY
ncbi:dTDP-4-amino-4,6-dideoxygalactose transaminase [Wenyingzhuangia heitensis]|uniref:dTDP-4-amino-4,6-dideoxygalactose transaminase n=1 Tax=Wenyingzhuangia heitensis TaxID=1487859 RepID=A0ABX0UBH0_9FLAO|nr:DegT/DnrJ/EryC1/StrS family aminotransferase [Wenyingzhuangia heitensis]NIJ44506.1 dTDP-4-amino-4,6-dideoxygalactose transaminase [Wenyingzhuangia heitensis]